MADRTPEPSFGPDEEGEVPLDPAPEAGPGGWVRPDDAAHREEAGREEAGGVARAGRPTPPCS